VAVFAELKTFVVVANFIIRRPLGSSTFTSTDHWFSCVSGYDWCFLLLAMEQKWNLFPATIPWGHFSVVLLSNVSVATLPQAAQLNFTSWKKVNGIYVCTCSHNSNEFSFLEADVMEQMLCHGTFFERYFLNSAAMNVKLASSLVLR
jgi:hypothetical protein